MGRGDAELTAEEQRLFEAEVAGARPLEQERHRPQPPVRRPVPIAERDAAALRELDDWVRGEGPECVRSASPLCGWDSGRDSEHWIEGSRPGVDARVLRRLARGEFAVQAELDLHGSDAATARGRLEDFLLQSATQGLRCVRIIHGRGRGSPSGVPVIKRQIPRWLSRGPARRWVLAYCSARRIDGGAGASYVLLSARRRA